MGKSIRKIAAYTTPVLLLIIFLFVWPGVWRYTYYERGMLRLDRLTGKMYRRQVPRYNAIWATLEKDLQNQRKRDPSLRPLTLEEMAKTKKSARLKEVTAAMEQHIRLYHNARTYEPSAGARLGTYEPTEEDMDRAEGKPRSERAGLEEFIYRTVAWPSMDYNPFSSESEEAIVFAVEKGYSMEEICSVRPVWCPLGIRNLCRKWEAEAEKHPGRSSVDDYEQALLHDWVPVQQE